MEWFHLYQVMNNHKMWRPVLEFIASYNIKCWKCHRYFALLSRYKTHQPAIFRQWRTSLLTRKNCSREPNSTMQTIYIKYSSFWIQFLHHPHLASFCKKTIIMAVYIWSTPELNVTNMKYGCWWSAMPENSLSMYR